MSRGARSGAGWRARARHLARNGAAPWAALRALALTLVVVAAIAAVAAPGTAAAPRAVERVAGGASSMDELIEWFLTALREGDRTKIEALRLTKDEYVQLVMPGHVRPGEPPQRLSPEAAEYFFGVMDTKSHYHREMLIGRFEGRSLELRAIAFEKGVASYAGHRVHKRASLELRDEEGSPVELRTGSVVERDGRFKFASFIRD